MTDHMLPSQKMPPSSQEPAKTKALSGNPVEIPTIRDAVTTGTGAQWFRYGTSARSLWFSVAEIHTNERGVFARLAMPGAQFLTHADRKRFKDLISAHTGSRKGVVAARPGWINGCYVHGDGTVTAPSDDAPEIIVTFTPLAKFSPSRNTAAWQKGVGPFVLKQPLSLVATFLGFVGPLLHFAPADVANPQLELTGVGESGKSTLLTLAMSVSAGDPNADTGGSASWNQTANHIDRDRILHADGLLGLDEANLAGMDPAQAGQMVARTVFGVSSTELKKRHTDLDDEPDHIRQALLSTSNVPLRDLIKLRGPSGDALRSRMVTIMVPRGADGGIFHRLPDGFSDAKTATEALRSAVNHAYGAPLRKFVRKLAKAAAGNEAALRDKIDKLLRAEVDYLTGIVAPGTSARWVKSLAIIVVAGQFARRYGIVLKDWGSPRWAVRSVYKQYIAELSMPNLGPSAQTVVAAYLRDAGPAVLDAKNIKSPITKRAFGKCAGVLMKRGGKQWLLVPTPVFQAVVPNFRDVLKELRDAGLAKTEGGRKPKLSIKAPPAICSSGRVYCLRID